MKLSKFFSEPDLDAIKEAVKEAEDEVSGEIVPVFVEKSGDYPESLWRSAVVFAVLSAAILLIFNHIVFAGYWRSFIISENLYFSLIVVLAGLLGMLLAGKIDALKRCFSYKRIYASAG